MDKARTLNDILDIEDSELVLDSLDSFQPQERWAIEIFIVYCGGSNVTYINKDNILKPSQITLTLIIKIIKKYYNGILDENHALSVFHAFQRMFVKKERKYNE
tara:strand:- start:2142 stop:2450 length:309 start_codon:yes stop_codon:yes gene_type:complete